MIDAADYRKLMSHYPTGVCVVTAMLDGRPRGMLVGSFNSVSLDPPLVGFFPDRASGSWKQIERAGRFFINILGSDQSDLCAQFGAERDERFAGLDFELSPLGSPRLHGIIAGIDCLLHDVTDAGDHYLTLGLVKNMELYRDAAPMVFLKGGFCEPSLLAS